ncbi:hypothetical protein [Acetilactobacillus jinshanensis]|uniref:Uncharacterized protein n=1 Tax=Acetilactobacillus jinshanensis TaxID=1720083 RepID=A0A4P6ZL77_9LACO|nr:hypothetical protein [Acetilactobacillus jinshanensis]QBP18484.1 hypothetical protein ELX58_04900 [Acetilactobacillus jinshanensis]URL61355.1 hypothetical protein HGK75_05015 [uncultured bacterium]
MLDAFVCKSDKVVLAGFRFSALISYLSGKMPSRCNLADSAFQSDGCEKILPVSPKKADIELEFFIALIILLSSEFVLPV